VITDGFFVFPGRNGSKTLKNTVSEPFFCQTKKTHCTSDSISLKDWMRERKATCCVMSCNHYQKMFRYDMVRVPYELK